MPMINTFACRVHRDQWQTGFPVRHLPHMTQTFFVAFPGKILNFEWTNLLNKQMPLTVVPHET